MSIIPFDKSFASSDKSQYWSAKNGDIKPRDVYKSSSTKKYWFDCIKCNHQFDTSLSNLNLGNWCPYCSHQKLCNDNNCIICYEKSFASQEKSKYWSNKNGDIKQRQIFKSSTTKKYWFDCIKCNHSFDASPANIIKGKWCPYCSNQKICIDCSICYEKSFASHEKSKYWSAKNGDIKPIEIFKSSNTKYWFECNKCNHTFDKVLGSVNSGGWCPYCSSPPKLLCNDHECSLCYDKSFACHEKSKYWSAKNRDIKPREIFRSSGNKYLFDCNKCNNTFDTALNNVVSGTWCPFCQNKTEAKIYSKLLPIYPIIITQFKQEWCKNIRHLPFDFCIPECKIIIELDGRQHFQQVSNWSSPEEQFENDKYKEKCANDNNYSVIRIIQEDVLNDTYDWLTDLCKYIEEIKNGDEIVNVYLCKNGEYDAFCI